MSDPHSVLGVSKDASSAEIRAAFRRLARVNHPDRFATAPLSIQRLAQRKMSELNLAYRQIGPRRVQAPEVAAASAYTMRQRREDAIRQEKHRRWTEAEARATERARAYAEAAGRAAAVSGAPQPPIPPQPPRPDPRKVFAGDGDQMAGPEMMLRRIERLRAKRSGTPADTRS